MVTFYFSADITTSKEAVSSFVENDIIETIESKIKLLIINNL